MKKMSKGSYLHSSMFGSYWIECDILDIKNDQFLIEYIDPYTDENITKLVSKDYVKII